MPDALRCAVSGLGRRSQTTYLPVFAKGFARGRPHQLVAVVDADRERLAEFRATWPLPVSTYSSEDFDHMLEAGGFDWLIVASPDYCHHAQILAALKRKVSIITEKPMALDAAQTRQILAAAETSQAKVKVTHNLRFLNLHMWIKQLLAAGSIGRVRRIRFDYHLTPGHGGSYFRRWHRRREASGGLPITKSCHHFDLFNWWLDDTPVEVWGATSRHHFHAGMLLPDGSGASVPLDADIDDTVEARIRYRRGARVSYSLNGCSSWEGYTLEICGTQGRITTVYDRLANGDYTIVLSPRRGPESSLLVPREAGRHSGADSRMLTSVFGNDDEGMGPDCLPGPRAGGLTILVGDAVTLSSKRKTAVLLDEILPDMISRRGGTELGLEDPYR